MHGVISSKRLKSLADRLNDEQIDSISASRQISDLMLTQRSAEGQDLRRSKFGFDEPGHWTPTMATAMRQSLVRQRLDAVCKGTI